MFCIKCGTNLSEGAGFCNKCGTKTVNTSSDSIVDSTTDIITDIQPVYDNQQTYHQQQYQQHYQQSAYNYQNTPYVEQPTKPSVVVKTLKIIGVVLAVFFVIGLFAEDEELVVPVKVNDYDLIRNSYLMEYSQTKTVDESFNSYFNNPQWKDSVIDGQSCVVFKGYCDFFGDNTQTTITFWIDRNKDIFNVEHIQMGMFSWEQDNILDVVLIIGFLTEVFE